VSYVTVLDVVNQMHWYMPCHEWLVASTGSPHMTVVQPDTSWQWTYVQTGLSIVNHVTIVCCRPISRYRRIYAQQT